MEGERGLNTAARFLSLESKVLPGVRRPFNVTTPAAGANWTVKVPGGVMWRLIGGQATFVASATVANRFPGIALTSFGVFVSINFFNNNVTAGSTRTVVYQPGTTLAPSAGLGSLLPVPFNPSWLTPGDTIASTTTGLDATDQYSAVTLLVEELYATDNQLSAIAEERYETELAIETAALGPMVPH